MPSMNFTPSRLPKLLFLLGIGLMVLGYYSGRRGAEFPADLSFDPAVIRGPLQRPLIMDPFTFTHVDTDFTVTPRAHYVLSGLIVSHNSVKSIADAYHDSSSVDVRDICVVWGSNLASGIFRRAEFYSEPWTCFVRFPNRTDGPKFSPAELSNTHLLTAKKEVRDTIWKTRIGDQITASGVLADYCPAAYPSQLRKTSLIRNDTGNGACEVMFVNDFTILRRMNHVWYFAGVYGWWGGLMLIVASPVAFLIIVNRQSAARFREIDAAEARRKRRS